MSTFQPPPHLMPLHSHRLQPQSSATREVELQYDKVDAEASSILIALANHNRKEQHASEMAAASAMKSLAAATRPDLSCASFLAATKRSVPVIDEMILNAIPSKNGRSSGEKKKSSPKQDSSNTLPLRSRQTKRPAPPTSEDRPRQKMIALEKTSSAKDPILLLAAAAAAVDKDNQENVPERHRAPSVNYERASVSDTKSESDLQGNQLSAYDERRPYYHNENHKRYTSPPASEFNTMNQDHHRMRHPSRDLPLRNSTMAQTSTSSQPPPAPTPARSNDRSNGFSHQYLSMKQNPKIKRNAMHAYITYMIYADLSHNQTSGTKDIKSSARVKPGLGLGPAPSSSGNQNYSATPSSSSSSSAYYNASEKDARYAYRREEKPYPPSSRAYHSYSQSVDSPSSRSHTYHSESYTHRSQPENERSNGNISRMPTSSLPPLPSSNGSPNNNRSSYGSDYYSSNLQRPTSSWSRSPVPPPPSLPPLHGYNPSRNISPTIRPSILPPPTTSSASESRSSIPPPLPLPNSTRDQVAAPSSSQVPNSNIFNRPLTAFLWSDGAAPARPPMSDRMLPPVSKNTGDPMRPDAYYDRV
ncbi:hypothetical protein VKS41_004773 [Umbelopsis sp. WA50703]